MNLLGRDIPVRELLGRIEERLQLRGLTEEPPSPIRMDGPEPRVDPLTFNLGALEEHADPTRPLPLHTHRGGAGQVVLVAKWAFRRFGQVFINEALGRQRIFNGHVRDSYAQLSAEVLRLRAEVATLKSQKSAPPAPAEKPAAVSTPAPPPKPPAAKAKPAPKKGTRSAKARPGKPRKR